MNKNRKAELMNYIELLRGLSESGFKCHQEMDKALKELSMLMIPIYNEVNITVVEDSPDGVVESIGMFSKMFGDDLEFLERENDDHTLKFKHINIHIFKLKLRNGTIEKASYDLDEFYKRLENVDTDYLINNTESFIEVK